VIFKRKRPPREFLVGQKQDIVIADTGTVFLEDNEQVTFMTPDGKEYDVARKSWGYYATPSLAGRLKSFGFRPAIMRSKSSGHCYIILVEKGKIEELYQYLRDDNQELIVWLDDYDLIQSLKITQ
jgi:hypothetical protein